MPSSSLLHLYPRSPHRKLRLSRRANLFGLPRVGCYRVIEVMIVRLAGVVIPTARRLPLPWRVLALIQDTFNLAFVLHSGHNALQKSSQLPLPI